MHETPNFLSKYAGLIKLDFSKIPESQLKYFQHMFVGGHLVDYQGSRKYRDILAGSTVISVSYDNETKTKATIFCREDGTEIVEQLHFNDEIISHDGDFKQIFEWLGKKFILYLRFIGGSFQEQLLHSRDVKEITAAFHALFPSYRFPELKLMVNKLPPHAEFIQIEEYDPKQYESTYCLHMAVLNLDVKTTKEALKNADVNALNDKDETPLEALLEKFNPPTSKVECYLPIINLLLKHGAKLNTNNFTSILTKSFHAHEEIFQRILAGSHIPNCKNLKRLPHINEELMGNLIEKSNFELFERLYPWYYKIDSPQKLLLSSMTRIFSKEKKNKEAFAICNIVAANSDVNLPLKSGHTLLTLACVNGDSRLLNLLINDFHCDVNQCISTEVGARHMYEGWSPIHFACWRGELECVHLLVDAGADLTQSAYLGATPYALANAVHEGKLSRQTKEEKERLERMRRVGGGNNPFKELSENELRHYKEIIELLKDKEANVESEPDFDKPLNRKYAAVAIITVTVKDRQYVLFVRKTGWGDMPTGNYLFPGGLFDVRRDQNYCDTAVRETKEETGLDLTGVECKLIYELDEIIEATHYFIPFFSFDLGNREKLPKCFAKSDIGEAIWFNAARLDDEMLIPIEHTNRLLLKAILCGEQPNVETVKQSVTLPLKSSVHKIISYFYFISTSGIDDVVGSGNDLLKDIQEVYVEKINEISQEDIREKVNNAFEMMQKANFRGAVNTLLALIKDLVQTGRVPLPAFRVKISDDKLATELPIIFKACQVGSIEEIKKLIEIGANMEEICTVYSSSGLIHYITPLTLLIELGRIELAMKIIDQHNVNVDATVSGVSPLVSACQQSRVELTFVNFLISKMSTLRVVSIGAAVNGAIQSGNTDLLKYLLGLQPINLNRFYPVTTAMGIKQFLPLKAAIEIKNVEAVKLLLDHGASPFIIISAYHTNLLSFVSAKKSSLIGNLNLALKYASGEKSFSIFELYDISQPSPEGSIPRLRAEIDYFDKIEELIVNAAPSLSDIEAEDDGYDSMVLKKYDTYQQSLNK